MASISSECGVFVLSFWSSVTAPRKAWAVISAHDGERLAACRRCLAHTCGTLFEGVEFRKCARDLKATLAELHWICSHRPHERTATGSALSKISTRPSDARPAITASRFTSVLLCCTLWLHISRTPAEPHEVRRCRQNDNAARFSRTPRQLQLRALDLLSSPC